MDLQLRYARTSDDITIAYTRDGHGSPLVWLPPVPFSNVVAQHRVPLLRAVYARLSAHHTLIQYDGRGTGHSERSVGDLSLDTMLLDLDAVIVDARARQFALFGYYHSCAPALAYAARHPGRVTHLVLFGGTSRGADAMSPPQTQALLSLIERDWDVFVESAAHAWMGWSASEDGRLMADAFRSATTPAVARATMAAAALFDVSEELEAVKVPTLILQSRAPNQLPTEGIVAMARALPDARVQHLVGNAASIFLEEADADVDMILAFLAGGTAPRSSRPPVQDTSGLSVREAEVLRLIAGGETNAEFGHRLGVSTHTVERHPANLYRKIGARGRADATAYAIRRGMF